MTRDTRLPDGEVFRRRNPNVVLLLSVITLGLYAALWLRWQAADFNTRLPRHPISLRLPDTALVGFGGGAAVILLELALPGLDLPTIFFLCELLGCGVLLLGVLRLRRRVLYLAEVPGAEPPRVGLLSTVLGNVDYLQSRINRYAAALGSPSPAVWTRPFRDSGRAARFFALAPFALVATLALTIFLVPRAALGIATVTYHRAENRVAHRFGPLPAATAVPAAPVTGEPNPLLALSEALDLDDAEAKRLKRLVDTDPPRMPDQGDLRFLRSLLRKNADALARIDAVLEPPAMPLVLEMSTGGDFSLTLANLLPVASLLFAQGIRELDDGAPAGSQRTAARLGELVRLLDNQARVLPLYLGARAEQLQLRLIALSLDGCVDAPAARRLAATLRDRPMDLDLHDAFAHEAPEYRAFERGRTRELRAENSLGGPVLTRGIATRSSLAILRYSMAGALDSLVLNEDLFGQPYSEMRRVLYRDVDELSYVEGLRRLAGRWDWTLPARLRAVFDSRRGAARTLRWIAAGRPGSCRSALATDDPLADLYAVEEGGAADCRLTYALREDFATTTRGELDPPPFSWPLGCS